MFYFLESIDRYRIIVFLSRNRGVLTSFMHFPFEQRDDPMAQAVALHMKGSIDSQVVSSHDWRTSPMRARTHSPS